MFLGLSRPSDIFWHFRFSREAWQLFSRKDSVKVRVITCTPVAPVCLEVVFLCSITLNDTAFTLSETLLKPLFWNGLKIVVVCPWILFVFSDLSLSSFAWTKQLWLELSRLMKFDAFSTIHKRIYTCCRKCCRCSEYFPGGCTLPSILNMLVRQGYVWQISVRHMNVPTKRI